MKLYIDKENLISLMKSKEHSYFNECLNLIRKNFDVLYNFPKNTLKSDALLMAWFSSYGQGVSGKQEFAETEETIFPPRERKSNFYNSRNYELLSSVYLLDSAHICDVIKQKSCILIGTIGEEIDVLASLLLEGNEIPTKDILSWNHYLPTLPLTDIIISDNHFFKSEEVYRENDNELIKYLCGIPNKSPVNLIIITKKSEIDSKLDLSKEIEAIKRLVKNCSGSSKSSATILTTYKTHDRALITNYYRVKNGCCFHLKDNGMKQDVLTEIKSHGYIYNEKISKILLSGIFQEIASEPVECYGDRKSNFLNFL